MDTLPTIKQILAQADRIGDTPMDEDSAREWFNQTVRDNRERNKEERRSMAVEAHWKAVQGEEYGSY